MADGQGNHKVRLVLGRATHGSAFVHGGYGANPPLVPMDVERFLPMLGFYRVRVE